VEIYRLHGAQTLRLWRQSLADKGWIGAMDDDRQKRTWEFFLTGAEVAFRYGDLMTFEALLTSTANKPTGTGDLFAQAEIQSTASGQTTSDVEMCQPLENRRDRHADASQTKAA
jgi:cyclopropane-fatty-acyl-phospholipid synthase